MNRFRVRLTGAVTRTAVNLRPWSALGRKRAALGSLSSGRRGSCLPACLLIGNLTCVWLMMKNRCQPHGQAYRPWPLLAAEPGRIHSPRPRPVSAKARLVKPSNCAFVPPILLEEGDSSRQSPTAHPSVPADPFQTATAWQSSGPPWQPAWARARTVSWRGTPEWAGSGPGPPLTRSALIIELWPGPGAS